MVLRSSLEGARVQGPQHGGGDGSEAPGRGWLRGTRECRGSHRRGCPVAIATGRNVRPFRSAALPGQMWLRIDCKLHVSVLRAGLSIPLQVGPSVLHAFSHQVAAGGGAHHRRGVLPPRRTSLRRRPLADGLGGDCGELPGLPCARIEDKG